LGFPHLLFPGSARWVLAADVVGLVAMVVRRNRVALFLVVMASMSASAVCLDPANKLYNVRFLPFWFLCMYLMAGYALGETVAAVARWIRRRRLGQWVLVIRERLNRLGGVDLGSGGSGSEPAWQPGAGISRFGRPAPDGNPAGAVVGPLIAFAAACRVVVPPLVLPAPALSRVGVTVGADQPSAWASWNYSGYERKPDFPEYYSVFQMMASVGATQGCGRAMWEYDPSLNRFGTTMSLMLLPYWTNGCVDSMEGLLFESASTTPFHFINQDELSDSSSKAVVGLPYGGLNVALGIAHLQLLGVKYLLASSTSVQQAAAADPNATLVDSSGPWNTSYNGEALTTTWKVYRIKDSSLVQPLTNQPVVWKGVGPSQSSWLDPAVSWYDNPGRWSVVPAADGPPAWDRVPIGEKHPPALREPTTTVTAVSQTDNSISFHVDRVGTPVEVKTSYFPNWQATGADGPWRVAPNLMVVVPTSHEVTLHYGSSAADKVGQLISLAAVVATVILAVIGRRTKRSRTTATARTL